MAHQLEKLGAQDLTQPMFAWTQVGCIIFPVFTATPISPSPKPVRIENNIARTMEDNLALAAPHIQSEKRAPTTSALQKIPKAAKPMTSDNGPVPMRKSPPNDNTWCSIHETSQHPLIDCKEDYFQSINLSGRRCMGETNAVPQLGFPAAAGQSSQGPSRVQQPANDARAAKNNDAWVAQNNGAQTADINCAEKRLQPAP
uniref:Uncharacterized protein n=1 Tax=Oryza sativa subsp. japonica TaxID=39947 RepID=Q2R1E8_ORYSJ|nr:hypothetical protein LOC_Os11g39410 [Oryza sativa Japonica Group]